jgi:serine/threonine protein kinase/predicted Zn-dependent protease
LTPKRELAVGSLFAGRYQIIEELGKGGMGRVYKVFDKELQEKVALKLLNPEIAADEKTIERFRNELKMARQISHKNVCRMYHLSRAEDMDYITMEFVSGENLKSMIHMMGRLSPGQALSIGKQICEGLAEAHKLGVVHRDLKPQNIMIDREGKAKIMDFGIARSLKGKGITAEGIIIGTPEYMSPEQVDGKDVDPRSDIYSLGIILFEMVTGRVPFEGGTPFSVAFKHKTETPPDPKSLSVELPEELSAAILRCLDKEKEKRFANAEDVLAKLTGIEQSIPTTERALPRPKPTTSKEITVHFSLKKVFLPVILFSAVLVSALLVWRFLPSKKTAPGPAGKPSLAILYFENISGDKDLEAWKTGFPELLMTGLAQSKFINVLSSDRIYGLLKMLGLDKTRKYSNEDLVRVANGGKVNHTISGSILKAGGNIVITLMLQKPHTGEIVSSTKVECKGEADIIPKADELIKKIKADLNLSSEQLASDVDREVGKITTSSPQAYKYYSEGRRYHNDQDFRQSIQSMEKAIAADPEFAMAYRSMAASYFNMTYYAESNNCLQKALAFSERISDRERYIIQADYYRDSEKTHGRAIEAYQKLLQLYPDDAMGIINLGLIYSESEEWDKALELYEPPVKIRDENPIFYTNLCDGYMAKGFLDKAKEVLESYLHDFPDNYMIHLYLYLVFCIQGKYDLALEEANKSSALNPSIFYNFIARGTVYRETGDYNKAEKEYTRMLGLEEKIANLYGRDSLAALYLLMGKFQESGEQLRLGIELAEKIGDKGWVSDFLSRLANSHLLSGNSKRALEEYDKAWSAALETESLPRQKIILHRKGISYLATKSLEEAQKTAAALKLLIEAGSNKKTIRYYDHLMGMIEQAKGNSSRAIENFKQAIAQLPFQHWFTDDHALFVDSLAFAYFKAGDLDKARDEYENITRLSLGRFYYGDIYAKSFYKLGQIYEQLSQKAKARENFQKFIDLWKNADPGINEVENARKRLANLSPPSSAASR